jgi:ATP-dependent Lon protease
MSACNKALKEAIPGVLPVIPTIDVVVFPHMIVPLLVLDERIIKGINEAVEKESKMVLLVASDKPQPSSCSSIGMDDLYAVGTIATIMRVIKMPEGGIKILVQGNCRARILAINEENELFTGKIEPFMLAELADDANLVALIKNIKSLSESLVNGGHVLSQDFHSIVSKMQDPDKVADFILSHITLQVGEAQELLEKNTYEEFLDGLYTHLIREIEVSETQERIKNRARDSMTKSQKEFYLREQLKAIKKELGEDDGDDLETFRKKLDQLTVDQEVRAEVTRQINRLEKTAPDSMEASVIRSYLEWVLALPWNSSTQDNLSIAHAKEILDAEHYGLKEIKERILDFISIRTLKSDGYAPILCFVGPPGTGKTSLGASIAKALGRNHFRVSLGGVKDEAEIRGHRRTYVGALPGRFIQGMRKAASLNPVIIIDELDKIGSDFRGDPSAAMLEVLDPQQNKTFYDNYLGVPFDLSKVIFVATANSLDTLSEPLRDRMEIIHLSGYTFEEKLHIARTHLLQKALKETGIDNLEMNLSDEVLSALIIDYTREAGVRELDRIIRKLCSKIARVFVEEHQIAVITIDTLEHFIGPRRFLQDDCAQESLIGICNGLAWTSHGGEVIRVEAVLMVGKGELQLTGQLGSVMKESAQAALSYARAHAHDFGIDPAIFAQHDLHIHVPAGSVPKDGPSAGITLLSAIVSAFTQRPLDRDYAMTGEINLQGSVMPIGGVKEKILAAKRNRLSHVILPQKNKNDIIGLEDIVKDINLIWVDNAHDVINRVLMAGNKKSTDLL